MARSIRVRLLAVLFLVAVAVPVRADIGPGPSPSVNRNPRGADQLPVDPLTGKPAINGREERPRRTGPFRSCGSGAGTGLAAIGVSWGLLWLGTRAAGRVRGTKG